MPASVQQVTAEREAVRAYIDQQAAAADISALPRAFAGLSSWVYKFPERPDLGGWVWSGTGLIDHRAAGSPVLAPVNDAATGYDGGAFYHAASRTLILANRGTETERDWLHNAALAFAGRSDQVPLAIRFAVDAVKFARGKGAQVDMVVVTGHSLGGGLAAAQYACLNPALAQEGQAPVPNLRGRCTASAPFGGHALQVLQQVYGQGASPSDARFGHLENYIRPGDPIRQAASWTNFVLGRILEDLPEVWTFWGQGGQPGPGHFNWALESFRPQAHSAHRYFQYFDLATPSCVVVNNKGEDLVLKGRRQPPGARRFNNPGRRWEQLKKLTPL